MTRTNMATLQFYSLHRGQEQCLLPLVSSHPLTIFSLVRQFACGPESKRLEGTASQHLAFWHESRLVSEFMFSKCDTLTLSQVADFSSFRPGSPKRHRQARCLGNNNPSPDPARSGHSQGLLGKFPSRTTRGHPFLLRFSSVSWGQQSCASSLSPAYCMTGACSRGAPCASIAR